MGSAWLHIIKSVGESGKNGTPAINLVRGKSNEQEQPRGRVFIITLIAAVNVSVRSHS